MYGSSNVPACSSGRVWLSSVRCPALLASFAVTVALAAYSASQDTTTAARWRPWLLPDQIFMQGEGVARGGPEAARALGAIAAGPIPYAASAERSVWISPGDSHDPNLSILNV